MPNRVPAMCWRTMSTNVGSRRSQRLGVAGGADVSLDGVEEPERRVGGVIQPFARAVGKHVRDEAVPHVVRERAEDVLGLAVPVRGQRQPFEADHRVAAPVGEPVIAGDHRAHFFARGPGARRFFGASGRRDDELIRREHQLRDQRARRRAPPRRGAGRGAVPPPPLPPPPASAPRSFPTARSTRRA